MRLSRIGFVVALLCPATLLAQPAPKDSTSARCMDVSWLAAEGSCEGRILNAITSSMFGATIWATAGYVGGAVIPTRCIGNGEKAAVRGAIAGAAAGMVFGLVTHHISRRELAEKEKRRRAEAHKNPPPAWSWRDVRPAVVALGVVAGGGALIGAEEAARRPSVCSGGYASEVGRGAAVYGGGATTTVVGAMLVVRFLF